MKTQAIQNQNFNGQLFYLTKDGEKIAGKEIRYHLPNTYRFYREQIANVLRNEPFDVFISRGNEPLHFNIKASDGNNSTDNILVKLIKRNIYTEVDHYRNSDDIKTAILKSIENFKKG